MLAIVFGLLLLLVHALYVEPARPAVSEQKTPLLVQLRRVIGVDTGSLLVAQFVALFNQTAIEVVIPPIVVSLYGFGQLYTSLFYMGLTVYLLVAFLVAGQLSKRLSDRVLVLCGWLSVGGGVTVLLLGEVVHGPIRLWQLCFGAVIFSTSSAFFETSVPSLFSKASLIGRVVLELSSHLVCLQLATRRGSRSSGSSQSLLMTVQALAILVGPLAVAPVLAAGLQWVLAGIALLWACSFAFFLFSFRHLSVSVLEEVADKPAAIDNEKT